MLFARWGGHKAWCSWGLRRALKDGFEAVDRWWLICVIETRSSAFREFLDHLACLSGCREWSAFYMSTSYCMPLLLPFLSFSFSFTSMVLRFINSLFMTSAAIRVSNKEAGENPVFSCLSLHCVGLSFVSPVFLLKKDVLLLCIRLESLPPPSFSLLLLLIVLVLLFFPDWSDDGKGQLSEEGLNTADKAFRRLQGSHSEVFPPLKS